MCSIILILSRECALSFGMAHSSYCLQKFRVQSHTHTHKTYLCDIFLRSAVCASQSETTSHTHTLIIFNALTLCARIESKWRRYSIHYFIEMKFNVKKKNSDGDNSWEEETKRKPVLSGIIIRHHACVCVRVTILFIYFHRSTHRKFTHKMWRSTKIRTDRISAISSATQANFYGFMKNIVVIV